MVELAKPAPARDATARPSWRARAAARAWLQIRAWPLTRKFLLVLCVVYLAKQALTVVIFPPFTGHDEVAHYAYVETVADEHRVPVLPDLTGWPPPNTEQPPPPPGDYIPDDLYRYCLYILGWQGGNVCEPANPWYAANPPHVVRYNKGVGFKPVGYQYAATHPPLYYLLMTPLSWLSNSASAETRLFLFRFAAIPFGLLTVILSYLTVRALFPRDAFLAITVPAYVAFQPQISYEAAMLNNDILAIALFSWIIYLLVSGIRNRFPIRTCVLLGLAFGLALLAKGTSLTAAPLIAVAMIFGIGIRNVRTWVTRGALVAGIAALLSWPWYLHMYRTYGNFDAFEQLQALQWWNYWGRDKPTIWELFWNQEFAVWRWRETWGEFGWRRIHLSDGLLWGIAAPHAAAIVGLVVYGVMSVRSLMRRREAKGAGWSDFFGGRQAATVGFLVVTLVVAYFAILQFGTQFELTQARYYFPAINALAMVTMVGLRTLLPERWRRYGQATIVAALVLLNLVIYSAYVIPYRLGGWV